MRVVQKVLSFTSQYQCFSACAEVLSFLGPILQTTYTLTKIFVKNVQQWLFFLDEA